MSHIKILVYRMVMMIIGLMWKKKIIKNTKFVSNMVLVLLLWKYVMVIWIGLSCIRTESHGRHFNWCCRNFGYKVCDLTTISVESVNTEVQTALQKNYQEQNKKIKHLCLLEISAQFVVVMGI